MKRFWDKVAIGRGDECWPWGASVQPNGYGQSRLAGKTIKAHRLAFELTYGPIPEGKHILHQCDDRLCCNPKHLKAGTHVENMADMMRRKRKQCPHTNGWALLAD